MSTSQVRGITDEGSIWVASFQGLHAQLFVACSTKSAFRTASDKAGHGGLGTRLAQDDIKMSLLIALPESQHAGTSSITFEIRHC